MLKYIIAIYVEISHGFYLLPILLSLAFMSKNKASKLSSGIPLRLLKYLYQYSYIHGYINNIHEHPSISYLTRLIALG
jgi:hypothetical protein